MKDLIVVYDATVLLKIMDKMKYINMILKTDGEAILHNNQSEIQKKRSNESLLHKSPVRDTKWNVSATDNSHTYIFKYSSFHDADSQDPDWLSVNTYSSKYSYNNLRTCWTSWFVLPIEISRVHI